MCVICIEWQKGKLTVEESWRNLLEIMDAEPYSKEAWDHYTDLSEKLAEAAVEESKISK